MATYVEDLHLGMLALQVGILYGLGVPYVVGDRFLRRSVARLLVLTGARLACSNHGAVYLLDVQDW